MIVDSLNNINFYKLFSSNIYEGLSFIENSSPDINIGTYKINNDVVAIVSEYETIKDFSRGYEAHKYVIDIQYPIVGIERVKWSPIDEMDINIPYNAKEDRTFYRKPHRNLNYIDIGYGVFAIMFPADGHGPQHFVTKSELIKKITIKVSV